ncbi:MAG TPA: integrase [Caldithrix sp.]|nr:integrase [Caldithrix sp.]
MGKLSAKMRQLMEMRNFSSHTISSYLLQVKLLIKYVNQPPENITEDHIIEYLYYMRSNKKSTSSTIHVAYCAIKYFYLSVLGKNLNFNRIPFPKKEKKLPIVLAPEEIKSIIDNIDNLKHKSIVMTAYSSGLRLSEIRYLKLTDIDSKRMQIHVRSGKGKKDRFSLLAPSLLKQLRIYYKTCKPQSWLFPGKEDNNPICSMSIQRMFKNAKKKPKSLNQPAFIPCATVLPPTCWNPALT